MNDFTILVNSSDGYEDCWAPFFHLLSTYWPGLDRVVLLNTERKRKSFSKVPVQCTCVASRMGQGAPRLTWSECLAAALEQVQTPLVLYLQEDYFLDAPVDAARIASIAQQMLLDTDICHVRLTPYGAYGPFEASGMPGLLRLPSRGRYRISTQAGLWRTDVLRSYLQMNENAWMFEIFGTWRAHRRDELFLLVDCAGKSAPISYIPTGIIKGRWHSAIPALFKKHGLAMNFDGRGFYVEPRPLLRRLHTFARLLRHPSALLKASAARVLG